MADITVRKQDEVSFDGSREHSSDGGAAITNGDANFATHKKLSVITAQLALDDGTLENRGGRNESKGSEARRVTKR